MASSFTSMHQEDDKSIRQASDITRENVRDVLPVDKTDLDRVDFLEQVDPHVWIPIIPDLLDWTCDPNWPSSWPILRVLRSNPVTIMATIPYIAQVLQQTEYRDDEHQNVLIYNYILELDVEYQILLLGSLQEFLRNITDKLEEDWDWRADVGEIIRRILAAKRQQAA